MGTKKPAVKKVAASPEPEKPAETREEKLIRLGNKRVAAAITKIRLIGNLSAYKPTDEQVDKIMQAIAEAAQRMDNRLRLRKEDPTNFAL